LDPSAICDLLVPGQSSLHAALFPQSRQEQTAYDIRYFSAHRKVHRRVSKIRHTWQLTLGNAIDANGNDNCVAAGYGRSKLRRTLERVTDTQSNGANAQETGPQSSDLSWKAMLAILALAILVAAAIAYLLVNPFFHQPAR
jgi:hypothetical protein